MRAHVSHLSPRGNTGVGFILETSRPSPAPSLRRCWMRLCWRHVSILTYSVLPGIEWIYGWCSSYCSSRHPGAPAARFRFPYHRCMGHLLRMHPVFFASLTTCKFLLFYWHHPEEHSWLYGKNSYTHWWFAVPTSASPPFFLCVPNVSWKCKIALFLLPLGETMSSFTIFCVIFLLLLHLGGYVCIVSVSLISVMLLFDQLLCLIL